MVGATEIKSLKVIVANVIGLCRMFVGQHQLRLPP